MLKNFFIILIITVLTASLITGCGENNGFLGETLEEKEMITSSEVNISIEKIRTLNPIITKDEDAFYINKLIYEGLFGFDKDLNIISVLADDYTYGEGGYSVAIKLKKGVKWHDGRELTAEDVKFTIESYQNASYTGNTLYTSYINNIKYVKLDREDPYRLEISFITNDNISMSNFTFPIIPKHQFKNVSAAKLASEGFIPIGTGPYKVVEYNELTHITLIGNELYYNGNIPQNTMNFQIMPDKLAAINLMEMNNISLIFSKDIDRDTLYSNKDVNVVSFISNEVELVGFNFKNSNMKNKKVRKAIANAINVKEIIEAGYFKNGIINDNIYYPNYLGIKSDENQYHYDILNSRKLLTEAGYIDRDGDGIVESVNNEKLVIRVLVNSEDQQRIAAAQIIKNGLDKLPIESFIIYKDWTSYNSDLAKGDFDIFIGGFQFRENYDMRSLLHTNYANVIGYSNPALDILLDKMESGISSEEKKNTFTKIKNILNDDLPYYCLLYKTYGAIASTALEGEIKSNFYNLYNGCQTWKCVYEKPAVVAE